MAVSKKHKLHGDPPIPIFGRPLLPRDARAPMRILALFAAAVFLALPAWADNALKIEPVPHEWGAELDFSWSPFSLLPGRGTTLEAGIEGSYNSWRYFHDPVTGNALSSADSSEANVAEALGLWFIGISQGLLSQGSELGPGSRPWQDGDLLEAFAYYRGTYTDTLFSGSYFADSNAPDKDGYLATAFLTGLSFDRVTVSDAHCLKQGYLLEVSTTLAPRALQSVGVDYGRVTAIAQGFLPLWDMKPDAKRNALSLLGAANLAFDRIWGDDIPAEMRQTIGGRVWSGVGGFVGGVGGAVRGVESGRFDGDDKAVASLELRLNLPGFDLRAPLQASGSFSCVPGLVAYVDGGAWRGLPGQDSGTALCAGFGAYMTVLNYGTLAVYNDYWLSGGSPYKSSSFLWHIELGMHF